MIIPGMILIVHTENKIRHQFPYVLLDVQLGGSINWNREQHVAKLDPGGAQRWPTRDWPDLVISSKVKSSFSGGNHALVVEFEGFVCFVR